MTNEQTALTILASSPRCCPHQGGLASPGTGQPVTSSQPVTSGCIELRRWSTVLSYTAMSPRLLALLPLVPLGLFYKMHFLREHRKAGTALPLTRAFNHQLSYLASSKNTLCFSIDFLVLRPPLWKLIKSFRFAWGRETPLLELLRCPS